MKWSFVAFILLVGLVTGCGQNTCQPGYYNGNCQYPAGYTPGGYYPNTPPNGYYGNNPYQPGYQTPYGNPYYRPY